MRVVIVMIDALQIQQFIFFSNKLKDIVGASNIVKEVTDHWIEEILMEEMFHENPGAVVLDSGDEHTQRSIFHDPEVAVEVVFRGGGNAQLLFRDKQVAINFKLKFEERTILEAPGLQVAVAYYELNDKETLYHGFKAAQDCMSATKDSYIPLHDSTTMGIHEICSFSGQVATQIDQSGENDERQPISQEIFIKRNVARKPQKYLFDLQEKIRDLQNAYHLNDYELEMPLEFDQLGRSKGENSYIGIVHMDGNGIGKRFINATKPFGEMIGEQEVSSRTGYVNKLRITSQQSTKINFQAVSSILESIISNIRYDKEENGLKIADLFLLKRDENHVNKYYLPIRMIVYGGDDITFVADGRLALELAAIGVKAFEKTLEDGEHISAAAGIALIKSRAPFYEGYEWAETLCTHTKQMIKDERFKEQNQFQWTPSAMDWVIAEENASEWLDQRPKGLSMKPYLLSKHPNHDSPVDTVGNWAWLRDRVLAKARATIQDVGDGVDDNLERSRKSKFRHMVTTMYKGEEFVKEEFDRWKDLRIDFPFEWLRNLTNAYVYEGIEKATPFIDAMEIFDFMPKTSLEGEA